MPILGPSDAFSPREWGATVDYDSWSDLYVPKDGVALHHGGGSDYSAAQPPYSTTKEAELLRSWERYHLSKGWRGLAYGWGVGQSGAIYRIRGWGIYGAHRGDVDGDGISNNREIVPVIWIASGNHHTPTPEAHESIVNLRRFIEHHAPEATRLWGHQEIQGTFTECPGPNGMTYVNEHRELEEEMVDRNTKADDGQPVLADAFQSLVDRGVFSEHTQPGGVAFNDEIAAFLTRFEKLIDQKIAGAGGGLTEDQVKAIINDSQIVAG